MYYLEISVTAISANAPHVVMFCIVFGAVAFIAFAGNYLLNRRRTVTVAHHRMQAIAWHPSLVGSLTESVFHTGRKETNEFVVRHEEKHNMENTDFLCGIDPDGVPYYYTCAETKGEEKQQFASPCGIDPDGVPFYDRM